MTDRIFSWDGEKIKEVVSTVDKKHTPKDILNGLDNTRGQVDQFKAAGEQLKQQIETNEKNIKAAESFITDLEGFEDECIKFQKKTIELIVTQTKEEYTKKAKEEADEEIKKSPEAYNKEQQKQLPFLKYQKFLATDKKMAEKVSSRMIRVFLYEEPIFDNPFKD